LFVETVVSEGLEAAKVPAPLAEVAGNAANDLVKPTIESKTAEIITPKPTQ
jgi:hypothetical protein